MKNIPILAERRKTEQQSRPVRLTCEARDSGGRGGPPPGHLRAELEVVSDEDDLKQPAELCRSFAVAKGLSARRSLEEFTLAASIQCLFQGGGD